LYLLSEIIETLVPEYYTVKILHFNYFTEIQSIAKKGFFHLFAVNGLIFVTGFVSQLFVAGILNPADIGRIKIMQTYIGMASLVGGLGFNTSLLKLASEHRSEDEKADLLHLAIFIAIASFLIFYVIFFVLSKSALISSDPLIAKLFPFYSLFLLPLIIQTMQLSYYQAIKELKRMALIQFYTKLVSVALIIAVTYVYKLEGYVIIISLTGVISIFSLKKGLYGFTKKLIKLKFKFHYLKMMWNLARYALLANLTGTLLATLDIYLINYLISDRIEVGYYMFALTILSIYQIVPTSIQQVAFPYFSGKSGNYVNWINTYKKYNKLNHFILFILCFSGMLIIPFLVKFAFSHKYDASLVYFEFLSIAWLLQFLNMMKSTALMGYGRFNINFYISLTGLVICSPLLYIFIKFYGLNGALAGRIISGAVLYSANLVFFQSFKNKNS
jgi:O-antigen/teichoic acid export membrane protein